MDACYTLSFLPPRIQVSALSHGLVTHTQASKHRNIYYNQRSAHTDPHVHTHICLSGGFGLEDFLFKEQKQLSKGQEEGMRNCTNRCQLMPPRTLWSLPARGPTATTASTAQPLLDMLALDANIWRTSQRGQADVAMAQCQTHLCQVSAAPLN